LLSYLIKKSKCGKRGLAAKRRQAGAHRRNGRDSNGWRRWLRLRLGARSKVLKSEFQSTERLILETRIIKLTSAPDEDKYQPSIFACSIFVIAQQSCAPTNIPSNEIAM
jgi:hypothetical protein